MHICFKQLIGDMKKSENLNQSKRNSTNLIHTRKLVGVMDASKSTITGISENLPLVMPNSYTFTVTAKDSSGFNVGSGGEEVHLKVTNH